MTLVLILLSIVGGVGLLAAAVILYWLSEPFQVWRGDYRQH